MSHSDLVDIFAGKLGLSPYSLFGAGEAVPGNHYAMMDGTAGSFVYSSGTDARIFDEGEHWAWSANVRYHLLLNNDNIYVRRSFSDLEDMFTRSSIADKIDKFFDYLQRGSKAPVVDAVEHISDVFKNYKAYRQGRWSLGEYLLLLASYADGKLQSWSDFSNNIDVTRAKYDIDGDRNTQLTEDVAQRFYEALSFNKRIGKKLNLGIAIRHAGGPLFQDTFSSLTCEPTQLSLYAFPTANSSTINLGNSSYYTPQALARSIVEAVIKLNPNKLSVRILDPACGSGTFLCEAVRCLERLRYPGKVHLHGCDISQDAVQMAKFALACAKHDCSHINLSYSVECRDFLTTEDSLRYDIVLMNPPFQSWERMDKQKRDLVLSALPQSQRKGRPDLSVAFVQKALESINASGVVGTIVPVGILTGSSTKSWRDLLASRYQVPFVSLLGDHSLFRYASVNVSAIILSNITPTNQSQTTMLWADEDNDAASTALRELRAHQWTPGDLLTTRGNNWNVYACNQSDLVRRPSWMPSSSLAGPLVKEIESNIHTYVSDFFNIRQGIRTGDNSAFIITSEFFDSLPKTERAYFKPIAEVIGACRLRTSNLSYVFFPNASLATEDQVQEECPTYYHKILKHYKLSLAKRASQADETFWMLSRPRAWMFDGTPRIVSRAFYRDFGYAVDSDCSFAIVQGFGWIPKRKLLQLPSASSSASLDMLILYACLFNSSLFTSIAKEFSSLLSGGYIEVANKFMSNIPLPDLAQALTMDSRLLEIAAALLDNAASSIFNQEMLDRFSEKAYRITNTF